jgi:hypothetical protein
VSSYQRRKRELDYYKSYVSDLEQLVFAMYREHPHFPHVASTGKYITPLQTGELFFRAVAKTDGVVGTTGFHEPV